MSDEPSHQELALTLARQLRELVLPELPAQLVREDDAGTERLRARAR